tara:strand:+ start:376 stop:657 length:282 start_codon:yes stop_codon:yes gene_type:complete
MQSVKNLGTVRINKGALGYLSHVGYKNWWYPDPEEPIEIPISCQGEHLHLWFNQGEFLAFKIPRFIFKPTELDVNQTVCVWFPKEMFDGSFVK